MRTIARLLVCLIMLSLSASVSSQEANAEAQSQDYQPVYITMTTTHWSDDPDIDFSDWLDTEKEYFNKVTSKNDLILNSGVYTHYFTPDNSEVVLVNVYRTWADIEKANERNQELIEESWPDEAKRKEFFDKQSSYYSPQHKDEIYQSMNFAIPPAKNTGSTPRVIYVRTSDLAMDGKGSPENFREYHEKITKKSKNLKGYYTHRHLWGSNSREMAEVFIFDKLADIEAFFDEEQELVETNWADEKEREEFMMEMGKIFTGKHGDYIYRTVPELVKSNQ
ncbi:hypothetical protein [Christiangramia sabulilitoris]|uniref:ABM domain-containing protein n=1 Tax=Christiangramia sabulilitoris TaxID=2583991 RepID=A0A550I443_9FLAO|nr:hypothetical protein [Christiangramia sabulilitoris]TRO65742.1 hypothetical protein FGM01_10140 [Christiangramia sabulilitoris]